MRLSLARVVSLAAISLFPGLCGASVVQFQSNSAASTSGIGAFTGSFEYTELTGSLTISLHNTNTALVGGFITGVVFNIPGIDHAASAALNSTTRPTFLDTGVEPANPFGMYEAGAALGGDWLGGGSPVTGIPAGGMGVFVFKVSAMDESSLAATQFLLEGMAVRFKGFNGGRSDKVPGQMVPTPGALGVAGVGCLALTRRRRR